MADADQLTERLPPEEVRSILDRELLVYDFAGQEPYGSSDRKVKLAKPGQPSFDAYIHKIVDTKSEPKIIDPGPGKSYAPDGMAWDFDPFPLSKKEEKEILKRNRWKRLKDTRVGDYQVSPTRYDLKWIQRIFWTAREIRAVIRLLSLFPPSKYVKRQLGRIRNQIFSLSPGGGKKSSLQSKLFSDVYYCLRQCNRLQNG